VDTEQTAICHCTDCQKLTGSAYRVSVPAREGSFHLIAGEPGIYVKTGDNGARRAQAFCPRCGSPLYTYTADDPGIYGLRAGCIAEREALVPTVQKWCRSALRWTENIAGVPRREGD
jgi:hypothetical protein